MALLLPGPERFVTLTWAPEDRRQRQNQLADLSYRIRRAGYRWELASTVEVNPKGTGFHIHGLQIGDFIPQAELQDLWGGRIVHIRAIKGNAGMAAEYVLKEATNTLHEAHYVLKAGPSSSRPVNITRGYFGGKTLGWARAEVNRLMYGIGKTEGWEIVRTEADEVAPDASWL